MNGNTRWWLVVAAAGGLLAAAQAHAGCLDGRLTGVNMAGAEFNSKRLPGTLYKDYTYPADADLAYFASKGATAIRLPFRWERVQRTLMGELDPTEVGAIAKTITSAQSHGLCVILDVHTYGTYAGQPIGSSAVPEAAFIDLWTRLAARFADENQVVLDLMNEPYKLAIPDWAAIAQHTVTALRQAGARQLILVSGGRYAGVHEWSKTFSGASNATAFAGLQDPAGRMAIEAHQYFDSDFSGTHTDCQPPERFDNMFQVIADWARQTNHKLFLGEFGTPPDAACLATLEHALSLVADGGVWQGWTYWAAGRWWKDYPLSIQPDTTGADRPQMGVVGPQLGH